MGKDFGIAWFAEKILKKPLYWYQEEAGDAIIESVIGGYGRTFTVMFARQMGKNQLSAIIEAYLLFCMEEGTIIKAAPTYKPQIINSRLRLLSMCESPLMQARIWKSYGYIIGCAPDPDQIDKQTGPRIMLFSAGPESNIVGATASLLLEIDEAQDVATEKFDTELKPMASTTNATTVLYGTAWSDDTLLAQQRAHNLELQERDGIRRHFEYDWNVLASINIKYQKFVESEIERLGSDHISIRTQYRLLSISGNGLLLNDLQRHLIRGSHPWQEEPDEEEDVYIAGLDMGGEERPKPGQEAKASSKRDSTILTIGKATYNDLDLPRVEIIHQTHWTGMKYLDQYEAIRSYMETWNIRRLVIDKTGLGEGMASLLIERFGEDRITPFQFTRPSKSKLTYFFLSLINSGRLKLYSEEEAPSNIFNECWKQLKLARYRIPAESIIDMYVPSEEGHDDFLISLALCGEAIREFAPPPARAAIIKPRPLYEDGRF